MGRAVALEILTAEEAIYKEYCEVEAISGWKQSWENPVLSLFNKTVKVLLSK